MPIKINVKTKIKFNGQEYEGVEAMPPEVRQKFEQIMAGAQGQGGNKVVIQTTNKIIFNGQEYASPDEMPEPVRTQYRQVMAAYDKNGNGIPDMLEGGAQAPAASSPSSGAFPESSPLLPQTPAPDRGSSTFNRLIVGLVILLAVVAIGLLLVTLRLR